jgi:peptidylprolyl isomerase
MRALVLLTLAACAGAAPVVAPIDSNPQPAAASSAQPLASASVRDTVAQPTYSPVVGLDITDLVIGVGREVKVGDRVRVLYEGTLDDGTVFDTTTGRGAATFPIGEGALIKGWDLGIPGMKVGGKRKLVIAPDLAYGRTRAVGKIPAGSTLTFVIELIEIV